MKELFYTCLNEIAQVLTHLRKQKRNVSLEYNRIHFILAVALQWLWWDEQSSTPGLQGTFHVLVLYVAQDRNC